MPTVRTLIGNIKGPKGDTGATGATGPQGPGATIEVGTVSTTAYGNPAQITNSGTETEAKFDFVIPQGKPGEQTTKMSLLTLDTITTQTTEYPVPAVGDVGSIAWGKIVKFFNDIKTAVTGKVDKTSIVNNLTSTSTDKPLSAAQGKALNDALAAKGIKIYDFDSTTGSTGIVSFSGLSVSNTVPVIAYDSVNNFYDLRNGLGGKWVALVKDNSGGNILPNTHVVGTILYLNR